MTITDPLFKSALHTVVDMLAVAKKKLANVQEEAAKEPKLQAEVDRLTSELTTMLGKVGFDVEVVDLLLAAR